MTAERLAYLPWFPEDRNVWGWLHNGAVRVCGARGIVSPAWGIRQIPSSRRGATVLLHAASLTARVGVGLVDLGRGSAEALRELAPSVGRLEEVLLFPGNDLNRPRMTVRARLAASDRQLFLKVSGGGGSDGEVTGEARVLASEPIRRMSGVRLCWVGRVLGRPGFATDLVKGRPLPSTSLLPPPDLLARWRSFSLRSTRDPNHVEGLLGLSLSIWPGVREMVDHSFGKREWLIGPRHGDLTPWNCLRTSKGGLAIVDWERASLESLSELDFVHYPSQILATTRRVPPRVAVGKLIDVLMRLLSTSSDAARCAAALSLARAYQDDEAADVPSSHATQCWRKAVIEGVIDG